MRFQLSVDERYQTDAAFRMLVDTLYACISRAEFTPTEIRQAAMLSQIHYENVRLPRFYIDAAEDATIHQLGRCGFCGNAVDPGVVYCRRCGRKVAR